MSNYHRNGADVVSSGVGVVLHISGEPRQWLGLRVRCGLRHRGPSPGQGPPEV